MKPWEMHNVKLWMLEAWNEYLEAEQRAMKRANG